MNYVFMDNFRGFSETFVPLRRTNFLVGENSTGKSSFLALFALLISPQFWFTQDFSPAEFSSLGDFADMVSVSSSSKKRFTVGYISSPETEETSKIVERNSFRLMTFRNEEGIPRLSRYIQYDRGKLLKILLFKKTIRYKILELENNFSSETEFMNFARQVFQSDTADRSGFTLLQEFIPSRFQLPIIFSIIESSQKKQSGGRLSYEVNIPHLMDVTWLAPIRTKPQRTYDGFKTDFTPEGKHTPYVIRKTLSSRDRAQNFIDLINEFGKISGMFTKVDAHSYGKDPSAPFEVRVEIHGGTLNISNVGYGVSQVLPVIVEMITKPEDHWFAIQQPEVHLHPRAQAAIGELIHFLVEQRKHIYVIETHSDYLIDRFRLKIKEAQSPSDCQVLFFERTHEGNKVHVLPINDKGQYPEDQPSSFRDFFIHEELSLLEI